MPESGEAGDLGETGEKLNDTACISKNLRLPKDPELSKRGIAEAY